MRILSNHFILFTFLFLIACRAITTEKTFLEDAAASGWYITSGSAFVKIGPYMDYRYFVGKEHIDHEFVGSTTRRVFLGRHDISRDGKLLVASARNYHRHQESSGPVFRIFDSNFNTLYENSNIKNHETTEGFSSAFRWSPNGKFIAFARKKEIILFDTRLETYGVAINNHKEVIHDGRPAGIPSSSHDSQKLTYMTENHEVAILDIRTKRPKLLHRVVIPPGRRMAKNLSIMQQIHD